MSVLTRANRDVAAAKLEEYVAIGRHGRSLTADEQHDFDTIVAEIAAFDRKSNPGGSPPPAATPAATAPPSPSKLTPQRKSDTSAAVARASMERQLRARGIEPAER